MTGKIGESYHWFATQLNQAWGDRVITACGLALHPCRTTEDTEKVTCRQCIKHMADAVESALAKRVVCIHCEGIPNGDAATCVHCEGRGWFYDWKASLSL